MQRFQIRQQQQTTKHDHIVGCWIDLQHIVLECDTHKDHQYQQEHANTRQHQLDTLTPVRRTKGIIEGFPLQTPLFHQVASSQSTDQKKEKKQKELR